jgi:hypothetical protein
MNWEYQIVKSDTAENFQIALNTQGREGWEAISGAFMLGEPRRVSLGQGMPVSTSAGTPMWAATMKRALK